MHLPRRAWLRRSLLALTCWLGHFGLTSPSMAQTGPARPGRTRISLHDQLVRGLRARRPVEFEFVNQVVALVNQGVLPIEMVQTTYLWARRKAPYPFPYFMVALTRRAKAIGVQLNSDIGG